MSTLNFPNGAGFDLSALKDLVIDQIVLRRHQINFILSDDGAAHVGTIVLEGDISIDGNDESHRYSIANAEGCIPGVLLGVHIEGASYERLKLLSIRLQHGWGLTGMSPQTGEEFGIIRVSRGAIQFLLPLI